MLERLLLGVAITLIAGAAWAVVAGRVLGGLSPDLAPAAAGRLQQRMPLLLLACAAAGFALWRIVRSTPRGARARAVIVRTKGIGGPRYDRVTRHLAPASAAAAVALCSGAIILAWSVIIVRRTDPGFDVRDVLTCRIVVPRTWTAMRRVQFYGSLVERVKGNDGIAAAGAASTLPARTIDARYATFIDPDGSGPPQTRASHVGFVNEITPGFLETMHVAVESGRPFGVQDSATSTPVAMLSGTAARALRVLDDALAGRRIAEGQEASAQTIVGIVAPIHEAGRDDPPRAGVYLPHAQHGAHAVSLVVRSRLPRDPVERLIRREVDALDTTLVAHAFAPLSQVLDEPERGRALYMTTLAALAILSLVLFMVALRVRAGAHVGVSIGVQAIAGSAGNDNAHPRTGAALAFGLAVGAIAGMAIAWPLRDTTVGVRPGDPRPALLAVAIVGGCIWLARRRRRQDA